MQTDKHIHGKEQKVQIRRAYLATLGAHELKLEPEVNFSLAT